MAEPTPRDALLRIVNAPMLTQCVWVAAKLGVADLVADGPKSCDDLATATDSDATSLCRILRCLTSFGVFHEEEDGRFSQTEMSAVLRSDVPDSARAWTVMRGEPFLWRPWGEILHSVKTGGSAFMHAFEMDWPQYFGRHPEAAQLFDDGMRSISADKYQAAADAYDFSGVTTTVDVGGGNGGMLTAILRRNPHMRGTVAELGHVIDDARKHLAAAGLSDRSECVPINMFESLPAGADAYVMANVIHDWDDERCVVLLRNCCEAMHPDGHVLLVEMVLPPRNEPHLSKIVDIEMLVMTDGGRERSEGRYAALFEAAGLRLARTIPTASPWSVLEAVRA